MKKLLLSSALIILSLSTQAQVKAGPWLSDVQEDAVTVLWTTEQPGLAFVELEDGTLKYETYAGRRIFRRLHTVTLTGLKPGAVVRYRVGGQVLKDDSNARNPVFGDSYTDVWHSTRTLNPKADACRFSVFNDVHMRTAQYASLAAQVDSSATDFLFLNGDIVSAGNYTLDTLVRYALGPLGSLTNGLPVFFARGNHEGRGNNVPLVADVFPHHSPAPFYYTFRQGPVAVIVLDAGETGYNRSILYSGSAVYEDYLEEQFEWARKALKEKWFRKAPVKLCILHVPMIDHPDQSDYLLQRWLNRHFVDMLNKAGIDLMIGADLHEFMLCEPGTMGNRFPILVNNELRRLDFSYTRGGPIQVRIFHPDGHLEFEHDFRP